MATPEELRRQQEENALLERENEILRKRLELQNESYSLSTSYLESIKEILGVQSKRTQFESDTLDINKKIQRAIRDQNLDLEDSVEKVKQVSRNKKLILEAQKQEIALLDKIRGRDEQRLKTAVDYSKSITDVQKDLQKLLDGTKEEKALNQSKIDYLQDLSEEYQNGLNITLESMSASARLLFYTKLQVEELEKVNAEREKELTTTDKLVAAANKLPGELGKSVKLIMDLNAGGKLAALAIGAFLVKAILQADDKITDLQKAFGITRETARGISYELERQAVVSGDIFITSKKLNQSFRELSAELGFAADISGQTLETFTNLTQRLGFNIKEATQLTYLARLQGENTETTLNNASKTVSALNKQKGTSINIKAVFNDIANASAATVVSLGGSVNALAEASTKARQLGLTLGEVDSIASSLLDFQSSIENELAAELMTGKQINLEAARYYALTNQTAKLTEEIGNNQELINAFATDNRLAQDAAAKALGLSREELGKMVMQQQFLALGAEAFRAKFGEANYEQMQALSIGDKFRATLEKIQEIIGNIGYAFEPLLSVFASLASSSTLVLATVGALAGLSLVRLISSISLMASQLVLASAGALTIGNVLTAGGITIAVLAGLGALLGMLQDFKTMDDGISTGYGKRMLFDKGELFALNDNDNIIATTNPIPVNDIQSRPKGAIKVAPQQAQATPTQQNVKVTPSTTVVQLALNGANIGNATARSTYKVSSNIRQFGGNGIDTSATV
jgi:galactitol-specific phosphotransferase system IIB component